MTTLHEKPDRLAALATLRPFQRETVDHVVRCLLDDDGSKRVLVADEVGLGKTLVAKGVVAEFVDRAWEKVERIDILYVCSNAALARENLEKLRIGGKGVGLVEATRFTLMPVKAKQLREHKLNFISITPGTALRASGGGIKDERVVLHQLLRGRMPAGHWLDNFLQGGVKSHERWREFVRQAAPLEPSIVEEFQRVLGQRQDLLERLAEMSTAFARVDGHAAREAAPEANRLIGDLRNLLAGTCIHLVQPDLIILDEFQRFKELLTMSEGEVAPEVELARQLFSYQTPEQQRVAMLLLSATPYRMFTTGSESASRGIDAEDHYADFLQTLEFLIEKPERFAALERAIHGYRRELVRAASGVLHDVCSARDRLQQLLLPVMCRRERVGSTLERDGMIRERQLDADLCSADVGSYLALERLREQLQGNDVIELWKSAPYLLNFGKGYELRRSFDEKMAEPALSAAFSMGASAHLDPDAIARFRPVAAGNGRLRLLAQQSIDEERWRMLWLPPSLPYWPLRGAWAKNPSFTKKLLFSSWNVVPDAVSAWLSYEVERHCVGIAQGASPTPASPPRLAASESTTPETSSELDYHTFHRRQARLLRFAMRNEEAGSMMTLALQLPCLALASIHPLALTRGANVDVRALMRARLEPLLEQLKPHAREPASDPAWYWAALLLLEPEAEMRTFLEALAQPTSAGNASSDEETDDGAEVGAGFSAHVKRALRVLDGEEALGAFPSDLLDVLVELAVGSPAIAWARTLGGFGVGTHQRRMLGAHMGEAFRSLFNQPAVIRMLQREDASRYWQATLQYAIDGNLQAVLDEYAHLLWEPAAWATTTPDDIAAKITEAAAAAITTKTSTVRPDYYRAGPNGIQTVDGAAIRTHFALRYGAARAGEGAGELRDDAVRDAFKSPFYPFVLASTSVGQEGLDFHPWCHSVWHWNLPGNPVDLEQREGRVHRYKGHASRRNVAAQHREALMAAWQPGQDPWRTLYDIAERARQPGESELVPCWLAPGEHKVERVIPMLPLSREEHRLQRLKRDLALYRVAFGQPRQAELVALLDRGAVSAEEVDSWVLRLEPGEGRSVVAKGTESQFGEDAPESPHPSALAMVRAGSSAPQAAPNRVRDQLLAPR